MKYVIFAFFTLGMIPSVKAQQIAMEMTAPVLLLHRLPHRQFDAHRSLTLIEEKFTVPTLSDISFDSLAAGIVKVKKCLEIRKNWPTLTLVVQPSFQRFSKGAMVEIWFR